MHVKDLLRSSVARGARGRPQGQVRIKETNADVFLSGLFCPVLAPFPPIHCGFTVFSCVYILRNFASYPFCTVFLQDPWGFAASVHYDTWELTKLPTYIFVRTMQFAITVIRFFFRAVPCGASFYAKPFPGTYIETMQASRPNMSLTRARRPPCKCKPSAGIFVLFFEILYFEANVSTVTH